MLQKITGLFPHPGIKIMLRHFDLGHQPAFPIKVNPGCRGKIFLRIGSDKIVLPKAVPWQRLPVCPKLLRLSGSCLMQSGKLMTEDLPVIFDGRGAFHIFQQQKGNPFLRIRSCSKYFRNTNGLRLAQGSKSVGFRDKKFSICNRICL